MGENWVGRLSRSRMLPFLAIQMAVEYSRIPAGQIRPPVTAGLIVANTLVYLRPGVLDRLLPSLERVSFNPYLIVKHSDMRRLFLSAFFHLGESHLVYNMLSLLWKGVQLETSMGSVEFASTVAALLGLSQSITLLLAKGLLVLFDYESAYYNQFSVGFSGVLFGMKVILNSRTNDYTYVHGMLIPAKYSAWAELILIQLFVPGVSFLGHLGGILAGLLYLKLRGSRSDPDPLTVAFRAISRAVSWPVRFLRGSLGLQQNRVSGRGRVGRSALPRENFAPWRCPVCTFDNPDWVDICEMCNAGRNYPSPRPSTVLPTQMSREPTIEEIRRRRLQRFGGSS